MFAQYILLITMPKLPYVDHSVLLHVRALWVLVYPIMGEWLALWILFTVFVAAGIGGMREKFFELGTDVGADLIIDNRSLNRSRGCSFRQHDAV